MLRAKVGLKLIPVVDLLEDKGSSGDSIIRISLEETNRIRSKLGLKLISGQDEERQNYIAMVEAANKQKTDDLLRDSLSAKRSQLKRRNQVNKGGILERDGGEVLSLQDWLGQIGKVSSCDVSLGDDETEKHRTKSKKLSFKSKTKDVDGKENDEQASEDTAVATNNLDNELRSTQNAHAEKTQSQIDQQKQLESIEKAEPSAKKRKLVSLKSLSDDELSDSQTNRDVAKPKFKKAKKKVKAQQRVKDLDIDFKPVELVNVEEEDDENLESLLANKRTQKLTEKAIADEAEEVTNQKGELIQENLFFLDNIKAENIKTDDLKTEETITQLSKDRSPNITAESSELAQRVSNIIRDQEKDESFSISSMLSHLKESNTEAEDKDEIKIKYTDNDGNELSTVEAFKFMSRKFHGNASHKSKPK